MPQKYKKHEKKKSGVKYNSRSEFPSYKEAKEFMDAAKKALDKRRK